MSYNLSSGSRIAFASKIGSYSLGFLSGSEYGWGDGFSDILSKLIHLSGL